MSSPRQPEDRAVPHFLTPWRELNGDDFGPLDYLNQETAIPFVVASQWLFCPAFEEYRGCIILEGRIDRPSDPIIDDWIEQFQGDLSRTEEKCNLTTLYDVFGGSDTGPYDDDLSQLAQTLAHCWDALLKKEFPDREFIVEVYDTEESYGPQVTFYSKPPETPCASAVVVYDLATGQFPSLRDVPDAVHVDLPPSLLARFAQLPTRSTLLREVDLRSVTDMTTLLASFAAHATTLTEAFAQSPLEALLFTKFEQLWVKDRSLAEQFVTELPAALAAARAAGRNRHVALVDLSSPTADAVLDHLRWTTTGTEPSAPIPVFHYPPSA
ncbi:hypothetical protein GIY23_15900 [Allosaccharopolyspora coralli]|uniref:Uncharacterized protein n=1 Tax=Allosaccharopolyspora coralli TaxID=2665642 RepID=A0A5Q3QH59_9PSEU|nr:hypothetical protein [Allosaccharopolyspora coralli]QGK70799.1 hypothetical protein GIY23_15900 [Allosaccharopolyspora coralli]